MEEGSRGPNVRIPPPLLFAFPLITGFIVQHFVPIRIVRGTDPERILRMAGTAEIGIALVLIGWAISTFVKRNTPVIPIKRARTLVAEGPFKITRNPMYLGFAVLYLGITFVANALWPLVFLPEALALTYLFAIRLEEDYLGREFGDSYREYCSRVRRWI
ncbi:MAG: isoprenylcysteine carboxylmethyltransferase family protein [Gemmatimonadota bacterium]